MFHYLFTNYQTDIASFGNGKKVCSGNTIISKSYVTTHTEDLQYRHLIPAPVNRTSATA